MEESHAKLRDRPCLEDRPSAARGLYLQGSACCSEARVLFKCFPFGECGNPATLVVWRFQETHLKIDGKVTKKDLSSEVANALLEKIKDLLKPEGDGEISADRKLFSIEELFEVQNSIYYRGMPEADLYDADGTVPMITNTAVSFSAIE